MLCFTVGYLLLLLDFYVVLNIYGLEILFIGGDLGLKTIRKPALFRSVGQGIVVHPRTLSLPRRLARLKVSSKAP